MITYQSQSNHLKNKTFALSLLKGRIGESVVETYLLASGYQVYPYGYENNYANITRFVRKDQSDATTTKIRSMPDLLVCDQANNERFLLQIKTTNTPDESSYLINKNDFESYVNYWPESLLVIYCIRTGKIYCRKIAEIKNTIEALFPNSSDKAFFINLSEFYDFTKYFNSITPEQYFKLNREISNVLNCFSPILIRSKIKKINDAQTHMNLELSD